MHYILEETNSTEAKYTLSERVLFLWEGYKTLKAEASQSSAVNMETNINYEDRKTDSFIKTKQTSNNKKTNSKLQPGGKKMCKMKTALDVINRYILVLI